MSRGVAGRRKIAIVALARKILVICWAMLRDGTAWRDPTKVSRAMNSPPEDTGAVNVALSSVGLAV